MPLADDSSSRALPPIPLALDEQAQAGLKAAWQFVFTHGDEPGVADRVRAAAERVLAHPIVIAFGGHWNAGKSTLLNALLGRDLLPVSERTETGVPCRIRTGVADEALSLRLGSWISIPCTREAIAQQVSITNSGAEPRPDIVAVEAVELVLTRAPLPPNVCWIDTPGLNDSAEADERLRRETERADQLLWVLNPDQHLAEVEQRFLADHIARRGVDSVAFLINVRTRSQPGADWQRLHDEALGGHRLKIERFWRMAGFPAESLPPILVASGAHLRDKFGAREMRRFLQGTDGLLSRRVVAVRIAALTTVVAGATVEIERRAEELRAREEQRCRAEAERQRRLSMFREIATRQVLTVLGDVREKLRAAGAQIAHTSQLSTVQSEADMGQRLSAEMHRLLVERWRDVVTSFHDAAARAELAAPSPAALSLVAADLAVPSVRIPPPVGIPGVGCAIGLWGCAAPMMGILLFAAAVSDSGAPVVVAAIICAIVAMIVLVKAGRQRARDLPRRVDDAIVSAATVYATQVSVAVGHVVADYAKDE